MCQDAGTAITMGKKGRFIWTDGDDKAALAEGARDAHLKKNLRYSQLAPVSMFEEKNTRSNMPAKARTPTGCCSSPRAAVPPTNRSSSRRRRPFSPPRPADRLFEGERAHPWHCGVPYHLPRLRRARADGAGAGLIPWLDFTSPAARAR